MHVYTLVGLKPNQAGLMPQSDAIRKQNSQQALQSTVVDKKQKICRASSIDLLRDNVTVMHEQDAVLNQVQVL